MLNFGNFNSLVQVIKHFSSESNCYKFLKRQRWANGIVVCPYCGSIHIAHRKHSKQEYRCSSCNKSFSVLVGTIFENTKLPISKWIIGMYLISSHKNGISSVQLAKDIEVTQSTAWYMLQKVRTLMKQDEERKLSGNVECDEMYLGRRETNKHQRRKTIGTQGRSKKTKTPIFGMVETRHTYDEKGKTTVQTYSHIQCVPDCTSKTLMSIIENHIENGSHITTDELNVYDKIEESDNNYTHSTVNHKDQEYVLLGYSTNRIEGFWAGFKRAIFATYHIVQKWHLQKYVDEAAFRYNTSALSEGERFRLMFDIAFKQACKYEIIRAVKTAC